MSNKKLLHLKLLRFNHRCKQLTMPLKKLTMRKESLFLNKRNNNICTFYRTLLYQNSKKTQPTVGNFNIYRVPLSHKKNTLTHMNMTFTSNSDQSFESFIYSIINSIIIHVHIINTFIEVLLLQLFIIIYIMIYPKNKL